MSFEERLALLVDREVRQTRPTLCAFAQSRQTQIPQAAIEDLDAAPRDRAVR
jgi:hypothetical protein